MADAEKPKTVKVTYLGDDPRPSGVLGGAVPAKGKTYTIKAKHWEAKRGAKDWKEVTDTAKKKPAKKKAPKKAPEKDDK